MYRARKFFGANALLSFLLLLQSCGSSKLNVDYHSPTVRFETPETTGKTLGVKALVGLASAHKVSLARSRQTMDFINQNPSSVVLDTNTEFEAASTMGYGADVGIFSRFDVIFSKRADSHYRLGGKFQILGKPGSKDTGFKCSVMGSYGHLVDKDVAKSGIIASSEKFTSVTGKSKHDSIDGGLVLGYRFIPKALLYALAYYEENRASATIAVQGQSDVSVAKKFLTKGVNLGTELSSGEDQGVFILAEGGLSEILEQEAVQDLKTRHRSFGAMVGVRF